MQPEMLDTAALRSFRERLRGESFCPGDEPYDSARRVFNAMIDKRPAIIVRCAGAADVMDAVNFARAHDAPVAVRAGGHSVSGKSVGDGGLVIDLSSMKGLRVDPARRRALAQPGLRLGEFDRETQAFGLATTLGIVTDTGLSGLTLGGGIGWLNGRYGLACDNVVSVDVVTAEGRLLTASADENDDLFWAVRGGGGNFGVVTSFEYQLHPVGPVLAGILMFPLASAPDLLAAYGEYVPESPDELTTAAALLTAPDGSSMLAIAVCHCGTPADGETALAPLRELDPPVADLVTPTNYVALQSMLDEAWPTGRYHYWKSSFLRTLTAEAIQTMANCAETKPSPHSVLVLQHVHGAAARTDPTTTAFTHRCEQWDFGIYGMWTDPAETNENVEWVRRSFEAMQPHLEHSVYANNLGDEGDERVRAAYGQSYERLVATKNKYDPTNLFSSNQNIAPTQPHAVAPPIATA